MGVTEKARRFAAKPWHEKRTAVQATLRVSLSVAQDVPEHARAATNFLAQTHLSGRRVPEHLLFYGFAPGDDMLCTAVLRELHRRSGVAVGIVTNYPELFHGNHDASCVIPAGSGNHGLRRPPLATYRRLARLFGGRFARLEYAPFDGIDHSLVPSRHIIAEMCAGVGITGAVAIRPYLNLTEAEKAAATWAAGRIVIQSSGMGGRHPMPNKQWYEERFQEVVDSLKGEYQFIQLGSPKDVALQGVEDLRGATSIRESAAILYNARLYVGLVGFLMHLARAVECPSVIIFGGREAPWQSGYVCNLNLYRQLSCAPCWRWSGCERDRQCMREISATDVIAAIRQMVARPRSPLAVESVVIGTPENDGEHLVTSSWPHGSSVDPATDP